MDTLTFRSKLVEFLAWPAAAILLVFLLRDEIRRLAPNLKKLKAGPVEAEFEREIKELRASADEQEDLLPPPEGPTPEKQMLLQLVQINPRSAILEAWRGVEDGLRQASYYTGGDGAYRAYGSPAMGSVSKESIFTTEELALYRHLRTLRNQAAHSTDFAPTAEAAINYIELSGRLRKALQR